MLLELLSLGVAGCDEQRFHVLRDRRWHIRQGGLGFGIIFLVLELLVACFYFFDIVVDPVDLLGALERRGEVCCLLPLYRLRPPGGVEDQEVRHWNR
jgi:hypothetical protein